MSEIRPPVLAGFSSVLGTRQYAGESSERTASCFPGPRVLPCGDTAICVEFGASIDLTINMRVQCLFRALESMRHPGIVAMNPTYRSLLIQYDPWLCSYEKLLMLVEECLGAYDGNCAVYESEVIEIPVCYGGEYGPDLEEVASFHGLTARQVVELHGTPIYNVFMIGFTPGFPYLGGLDERLYTPRKKEPRKKVPAGSVGLADRQTGIYSIDSPGGWQVIGRTPVRIFDLGRAEPFFLRAGDRIAFKPISGEEFGSFKDH